MAKELPYFKFYINDWLTGNVTLLDMETQGVFINVCVLFWSRDCDLKIDDLFERFKKKDRKYLEKLIEKKIICVENKNISIKFLEKQQENFKKLTETNKKNVEKRYETQQNQHSNSTTENVSVYNIDKIREDKSKGDKRREDNKENYDFIEKDFLETFSTWIKYKSDRKEKYKSIESEKSFYNKLLKLSNNDPVTAFEIVEQSMANNWAGIFELKNNNQNGNQQQNTNKRKANLDELSHLTNRVLQQPFTLINDNSGNI
jgi:hypothetical protein